MGSVTSNQQPLIVAVCGDSGSGKTTLTDGMVRVFGQERVAHICLDDYHTFTGLLACELVSLLCILLQITSL
ncbi:MAG: hypothetical protein E6I79_06440 [Chloroflexi bacterium]|nr:MAG: hypothetical protein E6I79_06440 [Chloroflexota bacterium]